MRFTAFFLFVACLQVSANGYSQKISISEYNVPLKKVFLEIGNQSGYQFFYKDKLVKQAGNVSISVSGVSIEEALDKCFINLPLSYTIVDRIIVIKRRALPGKIPITPLAQAPAPLPIQGVVKDEKGTPLQGVSISVRGTQRGTVSKENGEFVIEVNPGDILDFTMVGYKKTNVSVGTNTSITVQMEIDIVSGGEIVVVGYGTQRTAKVTGAITNVKMDEVLGDRPVSTLSSLMQNVVAGLQVNVSSGQPGTGSSWNVRGATDINTSGNAVNNGGPLILVDNVPINSGLNLIDPNDIESISVLKDAGSAAIYGGRSSFGVILITTKKGKRNQKPLFNYSTNVILANAINLPRKASASQFLQSLVDMGTATYWSGQVVNTWQQLYNDYQKNPSAYPNGIATVGGARYPLVETSVLNDLLGSNVPQYQNNFDVSGGTDKTTYRVSLGLVKENGIIAPATKLDYFKRYNARSVLTQDITNWLSAQVDASYANSYRSTPYNLGFSEAVNFPALIPISDTLSTAAGVTGINGTPRNIVAASFPITNKNSDIRLLGRGILKPLAGLTITGEYTYDNLGINQVAYDKSITVVNPTNFQSESRGSGNYALYSESLVYKALNIYGNYTRTFGVHNFSLMAGYNREESVDNSDNISRSGMIVADLPSIPNATGPINASNDYYDNALTGYFGRLNYDYRNKYLVQLNARYDGSSNFPADHRFGFFPSGSLGWRVTEESFMQPLKRVLSEMKLRASLGTVGNQNIGAYTYIPFMGSFQPNWLNGTGAYLTSLNPPAIVSPNYTWETVQTVDYGVDFGFFANKLTGSFDWYNRDTKDILARGATPLPAVLGTGAPLQNTASIRSTGYEVSLNWRSNVGKVKYHIGANLYDNQARITKFDGNPTGLLSTYYVGQKVGEIWGYLTDRLYTVDDFAAGTLNSSLTGGTLKPGVVKVQGQLPNPGDVLFVDLNGDGIINPGSSTLTDPGDRQIIGNSNPRYNYGILGGINYKNFDFGFVARGVGKRDMFISNGLSFPNSYAFGTIYADQLNYWTPAHPDAFYGRIYNQAAGNQGSNQRLQTRYLLDGSFFNISNLSLGYTIPDKILRKAHLNSFRVFCSVENPVMSNHLPKGLDPSLSDQGRGLGYPFLRKTSFGVNLSF